VAKPLFTGLDVIGVSHVGRREDGTPIEGEPFGCVEGRRVGSDIYEMINDALRHESESRRVRAVAECVRRFPRETLRHPEVSLYLEHLAKKDDRAALARIFEDEPHRGRPSRSAQEEFQFVAIMTGIIEREGCSAKTAAEIAKRDYPQVFGHMDERSIQNEFSRNREPYRLAIACRWLPSSKVTDFPWSRPNGSPRRR
jgi:hypothetical protein